MISTHWLNQRTPHWQRLEALLDRAGRGGLRALTRPELQELGLLYRQIAVDLATVREDPAAARFAIFLNQLLAREESYGVTDLQRVKHTRFTLPFLNFVLLLLAVACLLTRDPSAIKGNLMRCAMLVGACMTATFLSQQLAGHPQGGPQWQVHWPAIMAWLPLLIFGLERAMAMR